MKLVNIILACFLCTFAGAVHPWCTAPYNTIWNNGNPQTVALLYASTSITLSSLCGMTMYNLGYGYTNCIFIEGIWTGIFAMVCAKAAGGSQLAAVGLPMD